MDRTGAPYNDVEVAACLYIARYGLDEVGGWLVAASAMHRKEVRCKVRNIVSMCLYYKLCSVAPEFMPKEEKAGLHFEGLTGTGKKAPPRKTNLDLVQQLVHKSQSDLQAIVRTAFPDFHFLS